MVADKQNCGDNSVSDLGGGSGGSCSNNLLDPSFGGARSTVTKSNHHRVDAEQPTKTEDLPFAVDDDAPFERVGDGVASVVPSSSSGPSKIAGSRTLWGSTKADIFDGSLGGDADCGRDDIAEIASSLAVSSLHHRCAADNKIGLKMFESLQTTERAGFDADGSKILNLAKTTNGDSTGDGIDPRTLDFPSIKDQLSDFKSFKTSLMDSTCQNLNSD